MRRLPRLVVLQVASDDGEPLDGDAVAALVRSPALRNLERLRFTASDGDAERSLGPDGPVAIATWARLPRLRFLDLSWNPLDEDAVAALVHSPVARRLVELNLCRTAVPADALIDTKLANLKRPCISPPGGGASDDHRRIGAAYPGVLSPQTDWLDEP